MGGLDGLRNSSGAISRKNVYYQLSKSKNPQQTTNSKSDDPLAKVVEMYHREKGRDEAVVQSISHSKSSFEIALFNGTILRNIANFCCHDQAKFLSPLSFDFSFDFGNFYIFVGTYRNTSVYKRNTTTCPTMMGPLLICHTKNESAPNELCKRMVDQCEGLSKYLKVNRLKCAF